MTAPYFRRLWISFFICCGLFLFPAFSRAQSPFGSTAAWGEAAKLAQIRSAIAEKDFHWTARDYGREFALGAIIKEEENGIEPPTMEQVESLPDSVDWRSNGGNFVSPVKNQASCGSCWAFAAVGSLESLVCISHNTPGQFLDLAEQILVSCCTGNYGCSGGYMDITAQFMRDEGTYLETCFPYTATNNNCGNACAGWGALAYKIDGFSFVPRTVATLKSAVYSYGPTQVAFYVYSDFQSYSGGVYEYAWGSYLGGHAVLLIGYQDTPGQYGGGYFIVKNSWGTSWGESGFFRIGYSQVTNSVTFGSSSYAYTYLPPTTPTPTPEDYKTPTPTPTTTPTPEGYKTATPTATPLPSYCSASGGCDEYIARVQFNTIDNSSGCGGYADYTALSTVISSETAYGITVTNPVLYTGDACDVWVDWNRNGSFSDAGESTTLSGGPAVFTGTITSPAGAPLGETRLRIRLRYYENVEPCGDFTYGEVEDYTVIVVSLITLTPTPEGYHTPSPSPTPVTTPTPRTVTKYPIDDSYVRSWTPDTVYGAAGAFTVNPRTADICRVYIKFDLSDIPSGETISSAILRYYYFGWWEADPAGRINDMYKITGNWDEGTLTWNNKPGYDMSVCGSYTVPYSFGWIETDVTQYVQDKVNGEMDYGILVKDRNEQPLGLNTNPIMYSKEYNGLNPELVIEFSMPASTPTPTPEGYTTPTPPPTTTPTPEGYKTATPTATPLPNYCSASGEYDEYIARVQFNTIDNSSGREGYADYTAFSTVVTREAAYGITVTNPVPWDGDACDVWVDWNQNGSFYDAGESTTLSGGPGVFTGTITGPAGALLGETRLRIRLRYYQDVEPCGDFTYGEVEDYTVIVVPSDVLTVAPDEAFESAGTPGGPFDPASKTYTLTNLGGESLDWTAGATADWLTVAPGSGGLAAGASTEVEVSLNANAGALIPGDYEDIVTFANISSGFTRTRGVSLTVIAIPGQIAVEDSIPPTDDHEMPFGEVIVGTSRTEQVTVHNTDPTYNLVVDGIELTGGHSPASLSAPGTEEDSLDTNSRKGKTKLPIES
ncbi:MAG: C1 family peptidase, partial [PVC group bacterium]